MADHTNSPVLKQAALEVRNSSNTMGYGAASGTPADLSLPVGLHNIGNTCYLNSLLQYLFTVKPIRDVVLNYDELRLDLNDEGIRARLLGGNKMQMDRGEAVVAQACEFSAALVCASGARRDADGEQSRRSWLRSFKISRPRTRPRRGHPSASPTPSCCRLTPCFTAQRAPRRQRASRSLRRFPPVPRRSCPPPSRARMSRW